MSWRAKTAQRIGHPSSGEFSGRCLDGPRRGQHVAKLEPYFRALSHPTMVQAQCMIYPEPIAPNVDAYFVVYWWSFCLQCWTVEY